MRYYTSKLKKKKKVPRDFSEKKILKKELGLNTTMHRKYRRLHTYVRTPTHTYRLFLKTL